MQTITPEIIETARRAYHATSHHPEQRGDGDIEAYQADVAEFRETLDKLAATDDQRAIVSEQVDRYAGNLLAKYQAYWHAHARCMSSFITGPSKFPTRRNQKRGDTADRRLNDLQELRSKARASARKAVDAARTGEQVHSDEWRILKHHIDGDMATVARIDTLAEFNGGSLVNNHDAERIQILFDAKPDHATRTELKRCGFRWSPTFGAWQRKNTANGIAVAQGIVEHHQ